MEDVIVTSVSTGGSGGEDRLTENVSLNFSKYKVAYRPQKQDGSPDGGPIEWEFDIAAHTEV
jgi:type VI secretion system secreted protein Hcp